MTDTWFKRLNEYIPDYLTDPFRSTRERNLYTRSGSLLLAVAKGIGFTGLLRTTRHYQFIERVPGMSTGIGPDIPIDFVPHILLFLGEAAIQQSILLVYDVSRKVLGQEKVFENPENLLISRFRKTAWRMIRLGENCAHRVDCMVSGIFGMHTHRAIKNKETRSFELTRLDVFKETVIENFFAEAIWITAIKISGTLLVRRGIPVLGLIHSVVNRLHYVALGLTLERISVTGARLHKQSRVEDFSERCKLLYLGTSQLTDRQVRALLELDKEETSFWGKYLDKTEENGEEFKNLPRIEHADAPTTYLNVDMGSQAFKNFFRTRHNRESRFIEMFRSGSLFEGKDEVKDDALAALKAILGNEWFTGAFSEELHFIFNENSSDSVLTSDEFREFFSKSQHILLYDPEGSDLYKPTLEQCEEYWRKRFLGIESGSNDTENPDPIKTGTDSEEASFNHDNIQYPFNDSREAVFLMNYSYRIAPKIAAFLESEKEMTHDEVGQMLEISKFDRSEPLFCFYSASVHFSEPIGWEFGNLPKLQDSSVIDLSTPEFKEYLNRYHPYQFYPKFWNAIKGEDLSGKENASFDLTGVGFTQSKLRKENAADYFREQCKLFYLGTSQLGDIETRALLTVNGNAASFWGQYVDQNEKNKGLFERLPRVADAVAPTTHLNVDMGSTEFREYVRLYHNCGKRFIEMYMKGELFEENIKDVAIESLDTILKIEITIGSERSHGEWFNRAYFEGLHSLLRDSLNLFNDKQCRANLILESEEFLELFRKTQDVLLWNFDGYDLYKPGPEECQEYWRDRFLSDEEASTSDSVIQYPFNDTQEAVFVMNSYHRIAPKIAAFLESKEEMTLDEVGQMLEISEFSEQDPFFSFYSIPGDSSETFTREFTHLPRLQVQNVIDLSTPEFKEFLGRYHPYQHYPKFWERAKKEAGFRLDRLFFSQAQTLD